jgi:hypothetical protein
MIAIIQGTIGIIMSLETYHSVSKGKRCVPCVCVTPDAQPLPLQTLS